MKKMKRLEKQVEKDAEQLVESIREYSRVQADLWRLVPHLAVEADGRSLPQYPHIEYESGFTSNLDWERAYTMGYWQLRGERLERFEGERFDVYVDLENGELMHSWSVESRYSENEPARIENLLPLADRLEEVLNAEALVEVLSEARQESDSHYRPHAKQERTRRELLHKYKIEEVYTRHFPKIVEEPPEPDPDDWLRSSGHW